MEGEWTPTKKYLSQLTTYRGGGLIFFQDKKIKKMLISIEEDEKFNEIMLILYLSGGLLSAKNPC